MRLCSYVVVHDNGLAPNPFWGYCTLAVCTPNHMGVKLTKGDWIMGTTAAERGRKLLYAMQISEVLSFNQYYTDPRFEKKKPDLDGPWQSRCGDNMYYLDEKGEYQQHQPVCFHTESKDKEKDKKHPQVFISEHFYYFGEKAVVIPSPFSGLIRERQGCKCNHDPHLVTQFLDWLQGQFFPGHKVIHMSGAVAARPVS